MDSEKQSLIDKLKSFFKKCVRVWHILKKPTREEVMTVAKVSAIGIALIGFIGFIISLVMKLIIPR